MANESFLLAQVSTTGKSQSTNTTTSQTSSKEGQAEGAQAAPPMGGSMTWLFPIILIAVFYFLLIRPQQKKEKKRKAMLKELKKGDKVLTRGGLLGVIVGIKEGESTCQVKIGADTKVEVAVNAIEVVTPSTEEIQKG